MCVVSIAGPAAAVPARLQPHVVVVDGSNQDVLFGRLLARRRALCTWAMVRAVNDFRTLDLTPTGLFVQASQLTGITSVGAGLTALERGLTPSVSVSS